VADEELAIFYFPRNTAQIFYLQGENQGVQWENQMVITLSQGFIISNVSPNEIHHQI
jgi:hypothetical protein